VVDDVTPLVVLLWIGRLEVVDEVWIGRMLVSEWVVGTEVVLFKGTLDVVDEEIAVVLLWKGTLDV